MKSKTQTRGKLSKVPSQGRFISAENIFQKKPDLEGFIETIDHVALHYCIFGQKGPYLVLCDGIGCEGFIWKYLIPDLCQDYRILHWHYRGHGKSSVPENYQSLTVVQLAWDLKRILRQLVDTPFVLLGHSMGVQVILQYHRQYGPQMEALIGLCGGSGKTLDTFLRTKAFKYAFPYLLNFFRNAPNLSEILWNAFIANPQGYYPARIFQLTSSLCAKEDLQPYLDHLGGIDPRVFMELALDMGRHSVEPYLDHIKVPTLIMAGSRDRFTPVEKSIHIAKKIPGAEFTLIRGGTHTAPLEIPSLFSLRIRKFLRERVFRNTGGI